MDGCQFEGRQRIVTFLLPVYQPLIYSICSPALAHFLDPNQAARLASSAM